MHLWNLCRTIWYQSVVLCHKLFQKCNRNYLSITVWMALSWIYIPDSSMFRPVHKGQKSPKNWKSKRKKSCTFLLAAVHTWLLFVTPFVHLFVNLLLSLTSNRQEDRWIDIPSIIILTVHAIPIRRLHTNLLGWLSMFCVYGTELSNLCMNIAHVPQSEYQPGFCWGWNNCS